MWVGNSLSTAADTTEPFGAKRKGMRAALSASGRFGLTLLRTVVSLSLVAAVIAGGVFVGGFVQFAQKVTKPVPLTADAKADGIVVLTGAPARIENALELLSEGRGQRLLISGVGAKTSDAEVRRRNAARADLFSCCVDTERLAANTAGNAVETAKWVKDKGYKSLLVVTSDYHMPRSLLAFRAALPEVELTPFSVGKVSAMETDWWRDTGTLRLMLNEYIKYLSAGLRGYL